MSKGRYYVKISFVCLLPTKLRCFPKLLRTFWYDLFERCPTEHESVSRARMATKYFWMRIQILIPNCSILRRILIRTFHQTTTVSIAAIATTTLLVWPLHQAQAKMYGGEKKGSDLRMPSSWMKSGSMSTACQIQCRLEGTWHQISTAARRFSLFIDDDITRTFLQETIDRNARQCIAARDSISPNSMLAKWREASPEEMMAILGLTINMGLIWKPDIRSDHIWNTLV